ncbi:MAG: BrnT family toxin [Burkholderiales bacterium]|nr:BrnT family toxin [Burkholderiales bacterium]
MKPFRWDPDKNAALLAERGVSLETMVVAIESGDLLDILSHPNPARYPRQRIMVVATGNYAYLMPFIEEPQHYFLKTIIPSRKATRDYLQRGGSNAEN